MKKQNKQKEQKDGKKNGMRAKKNRGTGDRKEWSKKKKERKSEQKQNRVGGG